VAHRQLFQRAENFCQRYNLQIPVVMAPMAGACPPALATAVCQAGGMGACGTLLMNSAAIGDWAAGVRAQTNGAFQLNNWIPDPPPDRNAQHESSVRDYLGLWGPEVDPAAGNKATPNFAAQCEAMLDARPNVISSIMGLYDDDYVGRMKAAGIDWYATVTTVAEARAAVDAGADVVVVQGMEAGGHRGAFNADEAALRLAGLFSLLPAVVDAVDVPVIATGGIGDARGVAAAMILGASAVQLGTALLRSPEAAIPAPWADAIATANPEDTLATRAFSGRLGRSIAGEYAMAASGYTDVTAPEPAPYPVQRNLTAAMRAQAVAEGDINRMQAWAGQSARMAEAKPAANIVSDLWRDAQVLLAGD